MRSYVRQLRSDNRYQESLKKFVEINQFGVRCSEFRVQSKNQKQKIKTDH